MGNCCSSKRAEENKKYAMEQKKVSDNDDNSTANLSTQGEDESPEQIALQKKCE